MNTKTLSIIVPAYNESMRIGRTLSRIRSYFNRKKISYEVIVVDDGSTDGTAEVARGFRSGVENLRVLINEENKGKGFSVQRGMLAASGEHRLFMDADGSVDIAHLDSFMECAREGCDVVIGSIHARQSAVREHNGWHRRILGKLANAAIQTLAVPGIRDTQRGFKLFSAAAADFIFRMQTIERFGFDIETLVIAHNGGFTIQELPVAWDNPAGSSVTLKSYAQTLGELARITLNRMAGKYAPREKALLEHIPGVASLTRN